MKFPLDISENTSESLLFWITLFVKNKINTLSHSRVTDEKEIASAIAFLNSSPTNIEDISSLVNRLRVKANFDGVKNFYIPVKKLYYHTIDIVPISSLKDMDEDYIVDFLTTATVKLADDTKTNYKNAIINFFRYISRKNENSPNSGIGYIYDIQIGNWQGLSKGGTCEPDYLDKEEIVALFKTIENTPSLFKNRRGWIFYNLLLRILIFVGARISEISNIKRSETFIVGDEALGGKEIRFKIKGKGNYNRTLTANLSLLEPYYSLWMELPSDCGGDLLFCAPSNPSAKVSDTSVSTKIKKLLLASGIHKTKTGAHLFRHTYATHVYQNTQDLTLLQELLGHQDINTTKIYTHTNKDKMRQANKIMGDILGEK